MASTGPAHLSGSRARARVPVYRLVAPQIFIPTCSIVDTLHVVNFSHLDGSVLAAYDCSSLDQFSNLIEGAELDDG